VRFELFSNVGRHLVNGKKMSDLPKELVVGAQFGDRLS
jgi:hypothetical protein